MKPGRWLVNLGVPLVIAACFWALVSTSDARGMAVWVALGAFVVVFCLWLAIRTLSLHASATRLIGSGQPDELLEMAHEQLVWRRTERGKAPFRIYQAWGHLLRGDVDAAAREVDAASSRPDLAWASVAIAVNTERAVPSLPGRSADPAAAGEARRIYDKHVAALARGAPAARLIASEAEGKLRFAEGDVAGARPILEKLCNDVRLGEASRAAAHWYAARCALATGDRAGAGAHLDKAASLAPRTYLPRAVAAARAQS